MTEKQINQLKTLLSKSTAETTSEDFDQAILKASRKHIETQKNTHQKAKSQSYMHALLAPFSAIRTATIAVCLTFAIFLGMGQLLRFESQELTMNRVGENAQELATLPSKKGAQPNAVERIDKPQRQDVVEAPTQVQRDKMLLESIQSIGLPQTSELLATMDFSLTHDRSYVQSSIDLALSDIRSMIDIGELNNARQRYVQLKRVQLREQCPPCNLPDSLDALLILATDNRLSTG